MVSADPSDFDTPRFQAALLDSVGQAVIATDVGGIVIYWNSAAERLYGWTSQEAMGQPIVELTPAPQSVEEATLIFAELAAGRSWSGEFVVRHRDGRAFPVHVTDTPVFGANGTLQAIIGISTDVTERHVRLEDLRLSRQRIERLLALTPAVIFVVDDTDDWTPTFMSGNVEDLLGYPKSRFSEGPAFWHEIVYPDDWALLAPKRTGLPEGRHQSEYRFRHGDGSMRWLNEQLIVVRRDGAGAGAEEIIGSWTDITDVRATTEALQLADQQLQELMVQLSTAHEDERKHLSRELHDNLGQILTSASLFAKTASHDLPPERRELNDRVRALIDDALAATRSLAWTFHRSEQSDALEGRLQQLVEDVSSGNDTRVDLEFRGHGRSLSVRIESVVFRIVQEALTNVVRHAQARHAWVIVTVTGGQVGAVVRDDGVGFDLRSTATRMDHHVGLRGMEERAREVGGTLTIDSRPGWGTTVRLNLAAHQGDA
jgi:PAS domain S-box-containing protein